MILRLPCLHLVTLPVIALSSRKHQPRRAHVRVQARAPSLLQSPLPLRPHVRDSTRRSCFDARDCFPYEMHELCSCGCLVSVIDRTCACVCRVSVIVFFRGCDSCCGFGSEIVRDDDFDSCSDCENEIAHVFVYCVASGVGISRTNASAVPD